MPEVLVLPSARVRFVPTKVRIRPSNDSLPVAVPPTTTWALGQPGWVSAWVVEVDGHFDVRPWTIGDDISLQHGVRPW